MQQGCDLVQEDSLLRYPLQHAQYYIAQYAEFSPYYSKLSVEGQLVKHSLPFKLMKLFKEKQRCHDPTDCKSRLKKKPLEAWLVFLSRGCTSKVFTLEMMIPDCGFGAAIEAEDFQKADFVEQD